MIFKNFNKDNITLARINVQKALDTLGMEMGCKLKLGSITYGDFDFRCKLNVKVNTPAAFAALKPDVPSWIPVGKKVTVQGVEFIISGYKARSNKYPVCVKRVKDGRGFKLSLMQAGISRTY